MITVNEKNYNAMFGNIDKNDCISGMAKCNCTACNSCACGRCSTCISQCTGCKSIDDNMSCEIEW